MVWARQIDPQIFVLSILFAVASVKVSSVWCGPSKWLFSTWDAKTQDGHSCSHLFGVSHTDYALWENVNTKIAVCLAWAMQKMSCLRFEAFLSERPSSHLCGVGHTDRSWVHKIGTCRCASVWCGPHRSIIRRKRSENVRGHLRGVGQANDTSARACWKKLGRSTCRVVVCVVWATQTMLQHISAHAFSKRHGRSSLHLRGVHHADRCAAEKNKNAKAKRSFCWCGPCKSCLSFVSFRFLPQFRLRR